MAKILINYIHDKTTDEYELLRNQKYVFADQPFALLDTEKVIQKPLVVPGPGIMIVVDRIEYEKNHKCFKLSADKEGNVYESEDGGENWLPKDTDISKLRYINGRLVMLADNEDQKKDSEKEPEKEKNAEVKPQPKKSKKTN